MTVRPQVTIEETESKRMNSKILFMTRLYILPAT